MVKELAVPSEAGIVDYLQSFCLKKDNHLFSDDNANRTLVDKVYINGAGFPVFVNEYWTSRQRQASSIHEISYRACFKPQLPRFFINLLTGENDRVYDPFSGRGTTVLEAAMLGRKIVSNDINPLSKIITCPRLCVPTLSEIKDRLESIPVDDGSRADIDLSMFYHPETEAEIISLRNYLINRKKTHTEDDTDRWIRMIATNRLTGHSGGFFSVYTLPPNQAVSPESQVKINLKRNQIPPYRNTKSIILKKSHSLLRNLSGTQLLNLQEAAASAFFTEHDARYTEGIEAESIQLTVTSPPFLNIVQYSRDNWLRCWFNNIDIDRVEKKITMSKTVDEWNNVMQDVFNELFRVTCKNGWVAFEVGEVKNGKIKLEEHVIPMGIAAGFNCTGVIINLQKFTKTSNIWGVSNNNSGTNTNRIVLFHKA